MIVTIDGSERQAPDTPLSTLQNKHQKVRIRVFSWYRISGSTTAIEVLVRKRIERIDLREGRVEWSGWDQIAHGIYIMCLSISSNGHDTPSGYLHSVGESHRAAAFGWLAIRMNGSQFTDEEALALQAWFVSMRWCVRVVYSERKKRMRYQLASSFMVSLLINWRKGAGGGPVPWYLENTPFYNKWTYFKLHSLVGICWHWMVSWRHSVSIASIQRRNFNVTLKLTSSQWYHEKYEKTVQEWRKIWQKERLKMDKKGRGNKKNQQEKGKKEARKTKKLTL